MVLNISRGKKSPKDAMPLEELARTVIFPSRE